MYRIMVIDDEKNMCKTLEFLLSNENYKTYSYTNPKEALKALPKEDIDLIITDLTMPELSGIDVLKHVKEYFPNISVIMMTAYSSVESAVESIKLGAYDYLLKPFKDDELLIAVKKALELSELKRENMELKELVSRSKEDLVLIKKSPEMKTIASFIDKASSSNSNVLINGEIGTGKELIARLIHQKSQIYKGNFITINCSAVSEFELEKEFFGYAKNAFDGAENSKLGKLELASSGTIFLDEVSQIPLSIQSKLLRVIENNYFEAIGSTKIIKFNTRIIASTTKNLLELVDKNVFNKELFYRLNVLSINVPALRDRKDDIEELANHFIKIKSQKLGIKPKEITKQALLKLSSYSYPGNIRELENIIETALIISKERIESLDLGILDEEKSENLKIEIEKGMIKIEEIKKDLEKNIIRKAMNKYRNLSNSELAKKLGTTRRILEMRIKEYGLTKK